MQSQFKLLEIIKRVIREYHFSTLGKILPYFSWGSLLSPLISFATEETLSVGVIVTLVSRPDIYGSLIDDGEPNFAAPTRKF